MTLVLSFFRGASRWQHSTWKVLVVTVLSSLQKLNPSFTYEVIVVDDGSKDKTTEVIIWNLFFGRFLVFLSSSLLSQTFQSHTNVDLLSRQVAMRYSRKYGADKMRVLTLVKNRGKGGAVRMVSGMSDCIMSECSTAWIWVSGFKCVFFLSLLKGTMSSRGRVILMADADGATKFSDIDKVEAGLNELSPKPVCWCSLSVVQSHMCVLIESSKCVASSKESASTFRRTWPFPVVPELTWSRSQ